MAKGVIIVAEHTRQWGTRTYVLSATDWTLHEMQMEMLGVAQDNYPPAVNEILAYYPDGQLSDERFDEISEHYQTCFNHDLEPYYG